ncbi:MAG TPA: clan AA aspartic protease [Pyrinomonadaceae bacterium]|jgi:clan AA aspartic protease|nr:clan AA aspartic protease [Pyrinomonadaceae bacterium]
MLLPVNKPQRRRPEIRSAEAVSYGEKKMGLVYAEIELISGDDMALFRHGFLPEEQIKHMKVSMLVDSGAYMLVINDEIKEQLDLPILEEKTARLADETEIKVGVAGPVEIRFENRATTMRALVLPGSSEPLLGVIPMEDMDVVVDPKQQRLMVNPENPNIATTYVK